MPTITYSLSSFSKTNTDMASGASFSAYASGSPIANASITSGTLYLNSVKTYSSVVYLDFSLGSGSGSTGTFSSNSSAHSETLNLNGYNNALLTAGSGTISFTVRRTNSGSGNLLNIRDGMSGTLTLNYNLNYTACGAPTAVSVGANNVAPSASVTLSWSGASAGTGNAITGYQIYRATSAAGTYSLLNTVSTSAGSGSVAVAAPTSSGSSYYYKVLTVGTVSGYSSGQSSAYATLTCSFSAPTAPTTVTIAGQAANGYGSAGQQFIVLAWSGGKPGTNNPITGHLLYRNGVLLAINTSTDASANWYITAEASPGSSASYHIITKGQYSNSAASVTRLLFTYGHPTAPASVSVSQPAANAGAAVTLSWSDAAAGSYNDIAGYDVYRATTASGTYTLLTSVSSATGSGSCTVNANTTAGAGYYYKVITKGTRSNSGMSAVYATVKTNTPPPAPTISAPGSGRTIYNSSPRVLVTLGTDADGHMQTLTAAGYAASSTGNLAAGRKIVLRRIAALTAAGSQTVSATATDVLGASSTAASCSFNYAEPSYTDTTLLAGVTAIKAAHINELRAQVANVRAYYGLPASAWSESVAAGVTRLANWKAHILELRTAMDEVSVYVNSWDTASAVNRITPPVWIDIPVNKPTIVVMNQLRQVIRTL